MRGNCAIPNSISIPLAIICCFLALQFIYPESTYAYPSNSDVLPKVSEIRLFRKLGKIDLVIELSKKLINAKKASDKEVQDAYNELISAYIAKNDGTEALLTAEKALERFPNIKASPEYYPEDIEEIYEKISVCQALNINFFFVSPSPLLYRLRISNI